jgi:hypothetical protein
MKNSLEFSTTILRVAGPGVDLIVARRNTVTAEDLEPVGRGR